MVHLAMKRLLRKEVEDPLSMELLSNAGKPMDCVLIKCVDGKIQVELETAGETAGENDTNEKMQYNHSFQKRY